jgi:hypothetical protein
MIFAGLGWSYGTMAEAEAQQNLPVNEPAEEVASETEESPTLPRTAPSPASPPTTVSAQAEETSPALPPGTFASGPIRFRPLLEVRERLETRIGPYTAAGTADNAYFVGSRARLGFDAQLEALRLMVQVADARNFGQFPVGRDDGSTTGLHQGFLQVAFGDHWLRLGRQEISWGRQRMLGALNWSTSGRSFDALRLHLGWQSSGLELLGAVTRWVRRITVTDDSTVPPTEDSTLATGDYLAGLYYTWAALTAVRLDLYVLYRHDGANEGDLDRERDIASPGLRLHGTPTPGLSYDIEGVFQAGRSGGRRHLAVAAAAELAYAIQVPLRPGLALGGSYASGGTPGDSLTEFDNFFPTNHAFYGSADLFSWRNLLHGYATLSVAPTGVPLKVSINNHLFGLASPEERWANAGGATLGVNAVNEDRLLGYELDVNSAYSPWPWLKLALGYALFVPATAAKNLGHDEPTHWAYVMVGSVLP